MTMNQCLNRVCLCLKRYNDFMGYGSVSSPYAEKKIISLGNNCLSRSFPTEWGMKPRKEYGEKSMPFDLMWNTHKAVTFYLLVRFYSFFKNIYFDKDRKFFVRTRPFYTLFNHGADLGNDFQALKKRYKARIKNLYDALKSDNHLIFIQNSESGDHDINNLYEVIRFYRKKKPFTLIIMDLSPIYTIDKKVINDKVILIKEPYPTHNWIWYDHTLRASELGHLFESRLRKKLQYIIENLE